MRITIIVLALVIGACESFSQKIDITVGQVQSRSATLLSLSGEKSLRIDSVAGDADGRFTYDAGTRLPNPGVFRLSLARNLWVDFILDGEDVRLSTVASSIPDSMKFYSSEGNRLYYEFMNLNRDYKSKSEILHMVLARYPADDPYYEATRGRLARLQEEYAGFVAGATALRPSSFVARYIGSARLPLVDGNLTPEKQLEYLKGHALDHVDFTDEGLIFSDLFTGKCIEYLTYYRNPQLPKELLEKEFMVAVDTLLGRARVNETVYQHVTQYLLEGFKNFGFDKCIDYILENYVIKDDLCLDQSSGSTIQKMIDQKKLLAPGAAVPNIVLPDTSGRMVDLRQIGAENVLLVFYSSGCPHCQTMMPELHKLYAGQKVKNVEVLAVSLDTDRNAWTKYVRENGLSWISVADLRGWGGEAVAAYHVYATPTLIVLDREGRVAGVPGTVDEARRYF